MRIAYLGPVSLSCLSDYNRETQQAPAINTFDAAASLVEEFIRRGHHVTVLSFSREIQAPVWSHGDPLSWVALPASPHGARSLFLKDSHQVKRALREAGVDFAFANWSYEYGMGAVLSGIPHMITIHDAPWIVSRYLKPKYYWIPRMLLSTWVIARAGHLAGVSPYITGYLARVHKRDANVLPNPLPSYLCSNGEAPERPEHAGPVRFASLLTDADERKNPKPMLLGFRELIRGGADAELFLYGSGMTSSSQLHQWALANEAAERVHFAGRIDHGELMEKLRTTIDVLVHPSLEESFGLTIAEALACGIPVIGGARSGAVPWVAGAGKAGIMIDVRDPAEFTRAMGRLAAQPDLRKTLGAAGFQYAQHQFAPRRVAAAYLEIADALLANHALPHTPWD